MQVNVLEAKNRLSMLIKSAQAGEEVIIANRGQAMVRLVPVAAATFAAAALAAKPSARAGGFLQWLAEHPVPAHARRSHDQIEAELRAERAAWD